MGDISGIELVQTVIGAVTLAAFIAVLVFQIRATNAAKVAVESAKAQSGTTAALAEMTLLPRLCISSPRLADPNADDPDQGVGIEWSNCGDIHLHLMEMRVEIGGAVVRQGFPDGSGNPCLTGDLTGPLVAGQTHQGFLAIPLVEDFAEFKSGGGVYMYFLVTDRNGREYTSERRFSYSDFRWTLIHGRDGYLTRVKLEGEVGAGRGQIRT